MTNLANQTAIVTGGTRGIGRAVATLLARHGCRTIITGTKTKRDSALDALEYLQLDFSDKKSLNNFIKIIGRLKSADILINNAGINIIEPIDQLEERNWTKLLQVNLTGPMLLLKHVSRIMKKNNYGRIVNVSSILGLISKEKRSSYSATKAGLMGLTRAAALDLAKHNILVNAVCPGFTETELTRSILSAQEQEKIKKDIPLGRFAQVDEIARTVLFLASGENSYITGQAIVVDGGYTIK